jgi:hypothetical protein
LLFDVAAVLSASVALGPVAEAFGVHEITAHDTAIVLVLDQAPVVQPIPDAQPINDIGSRFGQSNRVLRELSQVSLSDIAAFVEANPTAIDSLLTDPPLAAEVSIWWNSLDGERRVALRTATPELVGNLNGIPFAYRDMANRSMLTSTIDELERVIANEDGRTIVENAKMQLRMLTSIDAALGSAHPDSSRTLMSLDVDGQGKAAIVLGNLRTADYVTFMVPGMFFTIEGQMGYWTDAAARLGDEQRSWLALLGEHPDATVATVAWIGYQTPNLTNVGSIENALEGRDLLAGAIQGLQSLRGADQPYVTVIGHSYGSTAALMALTEYDFEVDALAVVGSPGSPAKSVDELHVRDGNVYVGEAPWDPVPDSAFFGSDPGSAAYGAHIFGAVGATDPLTHEQLAASFGHIEYFSPGTESLRNLALIGIDAGDLVTDGRPAPSGILSH